MEIQGNWLHRLFVFRQLVEAEIDRCFSGAGWPANTRVVFYNEVDAGLGDVAFMTKLLKLLASEVGCPSLTLVTTGIEKQERFSLPPGIEVLPVASAPGHPAVNGCDLVVSAPGIFDHCRAGPSVLRALGLPAETPFLYLAEYGSIRQLRDDAFKALLPSIEVARDNWIEKLATHHGLDPDDAGFRSRTGEVVTQDEYGTVVRLGHLAKLFLNPDLSENALSAWMGQPILRARSCGLEPGEIGIHIDEDLLGRADAIVGDRELRIPIAAELENEDVRLTVEQALRAQTPIYQGYAHSGHRVFHDIVTHLEAESGRDVLLVIPDARPARRVMDEDFPPELLDRIRGRGFGRVEVRGRASDIDTTPTSEVLDFADGRTVRILTSYPLSHADMRRLMLISEPPTMVSGDQSFSDAVSALKALVFIEPVYCQTWHLDAVCTLADSIDPAVAGLLRAGLGYDWTPAAMDAALGPTREAGFLDRVVRLSRLVCEQHSTNRPIVHAIQRALWVSDRSEGESVERWLSAQVRTSLLRLASVDNPTWTTRDDLDALPDEIRGENNPPDRQRAQGPRNNNTST